MEGTEMEQERYVPDPDQIVYIPVEQLLLDPQNARLAWRVEGNSQEDLVTILWTEMAVDEVAFSIAENGFFRSEPLFVIIDNPAEKIRERQRFTVVEGNRRLTSVLLLRDIELRQQVGATNLPDISVERRADLDKLPAIVYPDRKSLWTTVGFRHINGIKPWDSFSKAEYVAEVHENYSIPLDDIADSIGDRHSTVKRLYRGYKVFQQAESQQVFNREDCARNRFYFSHLYTALDQAEFQQFLGIDPESSLKPNPVPATHLDQLEELMIWLYGKRSEHIEPKVRTQNPDLNTLRRVISKEESLSALRSGYTLERSYKIVVGDRKLFRDALTSAKVELQSAKATVTTGYDGTADLIEAMDDIVSLATSILREMNEKREDVIAGADKRTRQSQGRRS